MGEAGLDYTEMNREANVFAAYLLMPDHLIQPIIKAGVNLDDDAWVERVARKFRVPIGLVIYRFLLETGHDG